MQSQDYNKEEGVISLVDIVNIVKKNFWVLVATTLLGGIALSLYVFLVATPKYQSIGAIMVQVEVGDNGGVNTLESQRLVESTADILTKIDLVPTLVSEQIIEEGYKTITPQEVKNNMSVSSSGGSLLIQIKFVSEDPELAKLVNEKIIEVLIQITDAESYNMSKTLKGNISHLFVSEAEYHSPNKLLFIFVGFLLGGVAGLVIVFAFEIINSGYKTKEEIERELSLQVIGEIPEFEIKGNKL